MLEAGIEALWAHDRDGDLSREIVQDVHLAMTEASRGQRREGLWLDQ